MSKLSDPWTERQQRHLTFISKFTTDLQHVSGKFNIVADCLSRATLNSVVLGIDYAAMACAQADDPNCKAFPTSITSLQIQPFQMDNSTTLLLCDVSTGHPRPLVPNSFQRQVFEAIHNLRTQAENQQLDWSRRSLFGTDLKTSQPVDEGMSCMPIVQDTVTCTYTGNQHTSTIKKVQPHTHRHSRTITPIRGVFTHSDNH